jgi:hypothetical protein
MMKTKGFIVLHTNKKPPNSLGMTIRRLKDLRRGWITK